MIAQEILARQIAAKRESCAVYAAGLKQMENEYVVLKGLLDGEAAELANLEAKLAQLGGLAQPVGRQQPMHPLQAALARGSDGLPWRSGFPPMPQAAPAAPPIPHGLGPEDMDDPRLQEIAPRAGYQHMRQDPYGTIVQNVDQAGGIPSDVIPRGKIQGLEQPLITQDLTYVDPETKQTVQGV